MANESRRVGLDAKRRIIDASAFTRTAIDLNAARLTGSGAIMDVGRDDLLREVAALLEAAQSTADPQKAEELTQRAAVLISLVDELDALDGSDITLH